MTDTFKVNCGVIFLISVCAMFAELFYGLYFIVDKAVGAGIVRFILALLS